MTNMQAVSTVWLNHQVPRYHLHLLYVFMIKSIIIKSTIINSSAVSMTMIKSIHQVSISMTSTVFITYHQVDTSAAVIVISANRLHQVDTSTVFINIIRVDTSDVLMTVINSVDLWLWSSRYSAVLMTIIQHVDTSTDLWLSHQVDTALLYFMTIIRSIPLIWHH